MSPLKFSRWSPRPHSDGIWRWSLWEVIRFRWGHEGGAPRTRLSPCKRRPRELAHPVPTPGTHTGDLGWLTADWRERPPPGPASLSWLVRRSTFSRAFWPSVYFLRWRASSAHLLIFEMGCLCFYCGVLTARYIFCMLMPRELVACGYFLAFSSLRSQSFQLGWGQFRDFFFPCLLWIRLLVSYQRTLHEPSPSSWRLYPLLPVKCFIVWRFPFQSGPLGVLGCKSSGQGSFLFSRRT